MPLKTSFFNKGIFFNNIKRFWLITFSYSLFLLIFIMGYLNSEVGQFQGSSDLNIYQNAGRSIFSDSNGLMTVFIGFYSLISGLAVFAYMHFQKNTAMIHSLPLKRETLFASNYLSGLFIVTFPLLFNTAVLIAAEAAYGFPDLSYAFLWLGVNLSITFLLYTFTVFAGMFTGHMAAQAIFYLIYNFLAFFLESIITNILKDFLFGYVSTGFKFEAWSPLIYMTERYNDFSREGGSIPVFIGYLAAGILFLFASHLLYRKRHMEVASDVISFQTVKPIFKYVVAFCSSALLGGLLVAVLDIQHQLVPYILVYIFGGFIGYFSSEMLLKKTFKVFKAYKGFIVYALVLILLFCGINFDFFGYEQYVPQDSDVEMMFISHYPEEIGKLALNPDDYDPDKNRYLFNDYEFSINPPAELDENQIKALRRYPGVADSRESITKSRRIHDYIVKNASLFKVRQSDGSIDEEPAVRPGIVQSRQFYFLYKLKDGRLIERQYSLLMDEYGELDQLLREYLSLPEIKTKYRPILGKEAVDLRSVSISYQGKEEYQKHDIKDIEGFLKAYQADILNQDPLKFMFGIYDKERLYSVDLSIEFTRTDFGYNLRPSASEMLSADLKNTINFLINSGVITEERLKELQINSNVKLTW